MESKDKAEWRYEDVKTKGDSKSWGLVTGLKNLDSIYDRILITINSNQKWEFWAHNYMLTAGELTELF